MTDRTQTIVIAARTMFMRYGFTKTTMGDIATEAGVARQTVYNAFPGKDEVLRAVVRLTGTESLKDVQTAWVTSPDLESKLRLFHELVPLKWFEAIRAAPDWGALINGMHSVASEEMGRLDEDWKASLTATFEGALEDASKLPVPLEEVVGFFHSTSLNAKYGAQDVDDLRTRLNTIRTATLALIAPAMAPVA